MTDSIFDAIDRIPRVRIAGVLSRLRTGQSFTVAILSEGLDRNDRTSLVRLADNFGPATPTAFIADVLDEFYRRAALVPPVPQVVWTGPRVEGSGCDYTPTIVAARNIVDGTKKRLIIAGYQVTTVALEKLGIWSAIERGVRIEVIVNNKDILELDYQVMVSKGILVHRAAPTANDFAKFHVKALVGDGRMALVGSANFTSLGQNSNIEMGLAVNGDVAATIETMLDRYLATAKSTGWLITS